MGCSARLPWWTCPSTCAAPFHNCRCLAGQGMALAGVARQCWRAVRRSRICGSSVCLCLSPQHDYSQLTVAIDTLAGRTCHAKAAATLRHHTCDAEAAIAEGNLHWHAASGSASWHDTPAGEGCPCFVVSLLSLSSCCVSRPAHAWGLQPGWTGGVAGC
jgi:hypothetical protein